MKVKLFRCSSSGLPCLGVLTLAAMLAGCSGSGSSSGINSSTAANVRDFNAIPDSVTVVVNVNGTTLPGSVNSSNGTITSGQGFQQASSYTRIMAGTPTFNFTLTANAGVTYPGVSQALTAGTFYTAFLFGRAGISSASDPRYPQLQVVTDDRTAPPVGNAKLRIVQAAPDSGNVDVLINGQVAASSIAYKNIGGYVNVAGGNLTVQVNKAGTSTVLVPAATLTVSAGQFYTLLTIEPFLTPSPAYAVKLQSDGS